MVVVVIDKPHLQQLRRTGKRKEQNQTNHSLVALEA